MADEEEAEVVEVFNEDLSNVDPHEQQTMLPLNKKHLFEGTRFKHTDRGYLLTDIVDTDLGESYDGMPASAREVNVPPIGEDGEPMEGGDVGGLDDPTTMQQWHILQRFPVGTRTAIRRSKGNHLEWLVWEYKSENKLYRPNNQQPLKMTKGYYFAQVGRYDNQPPVRGRGGDIPNPPSDVFDLAYKGGYWYRGKKYP